MIDFLVSIYSADIFHPEVPSVRYLIRKCIQIETYAFEEKLDAF